MSNKHRNWIATPTETKIAWIVASCTLFLVIGAFLWPLLESREQETTAVVKEQPEEQSIEKIIAKVQSSEKHQIKAETNSITVTRPLAKEAAAPAIKKEATAITPKAVTAPPAITRQVKPSSEHSVGYYVQTGAFSDRKRAETLVKKLSVNWKTVVKKKSNNLYAVWTGPYSNSKEATAAKNSIAMRTKIKGFIVKN